MAVIAFAIFFFIHISVPQMLILIQTFISNWNTLRLPFCQYQQNETRRHRAFINGKRTFEAVEFSVFLNQIC